MPVVRLPSATVSTTLPLSSVAVRSLVVPVIFKPAGPEASKPTCVSAAPENAACPDDATVSRATKADAIPRRRSDMMRTSLRRHNVRGFASARDDCVTIARTRANNEKDSCRHPLRTRKASIFGASNGCDESCTLRSLGAPPCCWRCAFSLLFERARLSVDDPPRIYGLDALSHRPAGWRGG